MSKYEKLVLLLIALLLLGRFGGLARDIFIAHTYGATILPSDVEQYWNFVSIIIGGVVNIGAGIWLYIEAQSINLKSWVWGLLGLFFGLIGLVLFYLIQLFVVRHANKT